MAINFKHRACRADVLLMYLPNHFLFGATLATSPEATELWKGAGFTIFPFLFLKEELQWKKSCEVRKKIQIVHDSVKNLRVDIRKGFVI